MSVMLETSKVATSVDCAGMVSGVQFSAVFQSPLVGFSFQVALSAKVQSGRRTKHASRTEGSRAEGFTSAFLEEKEVESKAKSFCYGTTVSVRSLPSPPS